MPPMAGPNHMHDRLFSPTSGLDPIKSSILRESGMGWNSSQTSDSSSDSKPITSPLRIAKRDSPNLRPRIRPPPEQGADIPRRTSSSFKHVRNNNLVSKSPFKSQIPTPSTPSRSNPVRPIGARPPTFSFPSASPRRVSGEKRPRPPSLHEDAENENERPFSLKRERKQSKTFQGLLQKEPVTKSPFKRVPSVEEDPLPPPPAPPRVLTDIPNIRSPPTHHDLPPPMLRTLAPSTSTKPNVASPARSSLVSRRMHGPRMSNTTKRERRKTVTFDERCDVLEFDREEGESEVFESDDEQLYEQGDDHDEADPFFLPSHDAQHNDEEMQPIEAYTDDAPLYDLNGEIHEPPDSMEMDDPPKVDDSYESIALSEEERGLVLDPDSSITGLVDEMFNIKGDRPASDDPVATSTPPSTPPPNLPPDLETEGGVPLGRTHHRDRQHQYKDEYPLPSPPPDHEINQLHSRPLPEISGKVFDREQPFSAHLSQFPQPPSTPPRRPSPIHEKSSEGPLGRSTHMERVRAARAEQEREAEYVDRLPASPSPMKTPARRDLDSMQSDALIPKFSLPSGTPSSSRSIAEHGPDPFAVPSLTDEPLPNAAVDTTIDTLDPSNLSIGHSEVSLSMLDSDIGLAYEDEESKVKVNETRSEPALGGDKEESDQPEVLFNASTPDISTPPPTSLLPIRGVSPAFPGQPHRVASPNRRVSTYQPTPPTRAMSPLTTASSPRPTLSNRSSTASLNSQGSSGGSRPSRVRPRIHQEDIRRRLLGPRANASPSPLPPQEEDVDMSNKYAADDSATEEGLAESIEPNGTPTQPAEESHALGGNTPPIEPIPRLSNDKDRMSVMTDVSAFSAEMATIQTAERMDLRHSPPLRREEAKPEPSLGREFGLRIPSSQSAFGLKFDFGSRFGLGGLGIDVGSTSSRESAATIQPPLMRIESASLATRSSRESTTSMRMGDVDVDVEMKSALDRLMDDVASSGGIDAEHLDDSIMTNTTTATNEGRSVDGDGPTSPPLVREAARPMARAATDSTLLSGPNGGPIPGSRTASGSSVAPPVPPKDNIRSREELILEKRREARRREGDMSDSDSPPRSSRYLAVGLGRPSRRRSMSTSDADALRDQGKRRAAASGESGDGAVLDIRGVDDQLTETIEQELRKMDKGKKYFVREREEMIYASADRDRVTHMAGPGDMNTGRAWRAVRRPSDMNEYSKQIKEYRAQGKGKAYGKVFVKVLGVRGMHLPLPEQPTAVSCTLNNGIHFVTTPDCSLGKDCPIQQEFELIEHSKLEFTLTLKVRRDPHIDALFKAVVPVPPPTPAIVTPPLPPPVMQQSSSRGGVLSFFHSSPKKSKEKKQSPPPPPPPQPQQLRPQPVRRLNENLARYLKPDGMLARAFISFKDIAHRCDTRLFETSYPLIGQRLELGNKQSTLQVGELVLQIFRLPPLPGVPQDQLPQSLDDCHRGLRYINWHKVTYFEGILTQNGGDCNTWRRRQFRVIGGNLVAFNDVTKKATATIDLKRALAVEDDQDVRNGLSSPQSDFDTLGGVERSFRLKFPEDEEIVFFADSDEEKSKWLEVLRALVGHIPPHPLWAELLWQHQEELAKTRSPQSS